MRQIEELLIVGVGVDGGHDPFGETELFVEHLHQRSEAVRGARRIRDEMMVRRIVFVVVDAHHHGEILVFGRRGDDDFLGSGLEMFRSVLALGEEASGLDDDFDAELFPRKFRGIAFLQHFEALASGNDGVAVGADVLCEVAEDGVVLEKVGQRVGVRDVVDGDDVDAAISECGAENVPPDAPEAVDPYLDCHLRLLIREYKVTLAEVSMSKCLRVCRNSLIFS